MPRFRNVDGVEVTVSDETAALLGMGWSAVKSGDKSAAAPTTTGAAKPRKSTAKKSTRKATAKKVAASPQPAAPSVEPAAPEPTVDSTAPTIN